MKINGEMHDLWRAVDHEGEVLESFASKTGDKVPALTLMKKLMKRNGHAKAITTDGLRSYKAAIKDLGNTAKQEVDRRPTKRLGTSTYPSNEESGPCSAFAR